MPTIVNLPDCSPIKTKILPPIVKNKKQPLNNIETNSLEDITVGDLISKMKYKGLLND